MKLFLYGLLIGMFKVLPGISGGILVVSLNLYDKLIESLNQLKDKKNILFLIKLFSGICLSIILTSKLIYKLLINNTYIVMPIVIGIIIVSIKSIIIKINKNINYKNMIKVIFFIISVFIIIYKFKNKINFIFKYFIMGIVESISTIIPGISGTAIFAFLGWYKELLYNISTIIQFKPLSLNLPFIMPYMSGLIISSIFLIIWLKKILSKYQSEFYLVILIILIYSIIKLLTIYLINWYTFAFISVGIIVGVIFNKISNI